MGWWSSWPGSGGFGCSLQFSSFQCRRSEGITIGAVDLGWSLVGGVGGRGCRHNFLGSSGGLDLVVLEAAVSEDRWVVAVVGDAEWWDVLVAVARASLTGLWNDRVSAIGRIDIFHA